MSAPRPASQKRRARVLGERLRSQRHTLKLKQREVAAQIPMSAGHLSRIEKGEYGPPSDEVIERMAEILGLDALELLQIAGRELGEETFQQRVLAELAAIKSSLDRLEATVQPLTTQR